MGSQAAVALIALILQYGPTAAIQLIKGLKTDNPTPAEIRALKVDSPYSYFEEK